MLIESMVAASTAATAHASARSRMRAASVSRRAGSSSLLSFSPRIGRSGERMTAAATTGPNSAPRPTSSTPATQRKPLARTSRSMVASQRILPHAASGRMESGTLFALAQARRFALQVAQVVELGAADAARADHVDMVDHAGMYGEDALHALSEADLANRDGLAESRVVAGNHHAFESLQPLLVAFLDLDVDPNCIARPERRYIGPDVLLNKLRQQRVLHLEISLNCLFYNGEGRVCWGPNGSGSIFSSKNEPGAGSDAI